MVLLLYPGGKKSNEDPRLSLNTIKILIGPTTILILLCLSIIHGVRINLSLPLYQNRKGIWIPMSDLQSLTSCEDILFREIRDSIIPENNVALDRDTHRI